MTVPAAPIWVQQDLALHPAGLEAGTSRPQGSPGQAPSLSSPSPALQPRALRGRVSCADVLAALQTVTVLFSPSFSCCLACALGVSPVLTYFVSQAQLALPVCCHYPLWRRGHQPFSLWPSDSRPLTLHPTPTPWPSARSSALCCDLVSHVTQLLGSVYPLLSSL